MLILFHSLLWQGHLSVDQVVPRPLQAGRRDGAAIATLGNLFQPQVAVNSKRISGFLFDLIFYNFFLS